MAPIDASHPPLRRPRPAIALLAAGALAAAAASCGGSGDKDKTLTRAEVIKRGSVICKAAERRANQLPAPTSRDPFAKGTSTVERQRARRFLTGYADALESSREGLRKLDAPPQGKPLLDGYVRDIGNVVAELRAASRAPDAKVVKQADAAFALFARASSQTARYGFPKGVCGSG